MRRYITAVFAGLVLLLCTEAAASAQMTLGVRGGVSSFSDPAHSPSGGALTVGYQMPFSLLQVDLGYDAWSVSQDAEGTVGDRRVSRVGMDAAWMPRIYGSRTHAFNLYLGAGLTGGLELSADRGEEGDGKVPLFVGAYPVAQAEVFVAKRFALFAEARVPYYIIKASRDFEFRSSVGARFLF